MTIKWSFSYNPFVKLSLYNTIHLNKYIPKYPKHSVIKGLHCCWIHYDLDGKKKTHSEASQASFTKLLYI